MPAPTNYIYFTASDKSARLPPRAIPAAAIAAAAVPAPISTTPVAATAAGGAPISRTGFFGCPAFENSLTAEANFAAVIHIGDHDHDFIAEADFVFNRLDTIIGQLRDMNQTITTRQEFHERTVGFNAGDAPGVNLADFGIFGQAANFIHRLCR
jgi:hypothetical protein